MSLATLRSRALLPAFAALAALALVQAAAVPAARASGVKAGQSLPFGASTKGYVPDYDAGPQIRAYADLVFRTYATARTEAERMQTAIAAFLAAPSRLTQARAREAWINARTAYLVSEAFRFYEGPIDHGPDKNGVEGPEGRINAWPLNEAFIDYVKGNPKAGLVNDTSVPVTLKTILARDQVDDEADVTTGWHAIEFLLWGQDLDPVGAGRRPAADYEPGDAVRERRRTYLRLATARLVDDLKDLETAWAPDRPGNYAAAFVAMDQHEAVSRILTSLATLSGFEMAGERLATALDSGDQEDEQSCFSDNTRADLIYDLKGIKNVYFGDFGDTDGAGLDALLAGTAPKLNAKMIALINRAEDSLDAIDQPFDSMLAAEPGSYARKKGERALVALLDLSDAFLEVGRALGVKVIVPSGEGE